MVHKENILPRYVNDNVESEDVAMNCLPSYVYVVNRYIDVLK